MRDRRRSFVTISCVDWVRMACVCCSHFIYTCVSMDCHWWRSHLSWSRWWVLMRHPNGWIKMLMINSWGDADGGFRRALLPTLAATRTICSVFCLAFVVFVCPHVKRINMKAITNDRDFDLAPVTVLREPKTNWSHIGVICGRWVVCALVSVCA